MIELSLGRCIYIYDSHLTKAYAKKTATATACFLLSCFYRDDELVRRSLGGKNGKQCVNTDILSSILSKYNHNLTIILIYFYSSSACYELFSFVAFILKCLKPLSLSLVVQVY